MTLSLRHDIIALINYVLTFGVICEIPFMILFFRNRHKHPIQRRLWQVILALDFMLIGLTISQFNNSTFGVESLPCPTTYFFGYFFSTMCFVLYDYRLLYLLFQYELTQSTLLTTSV